jgi:soluble lytic murein transglycosylase-like protein
MPWVRGGLAALALAAAAPAPAAADLVFLANGRSISVRAVDTVDGRTRLLLRDGGEILCDPALILAVAPDEVPRADPVLAESAVPELATDARGGFPFADLVGPLAAEHRVDPRLVRAVIETESGYHPRARSRRGALGLMQLMPVTARSYAVVDPFDPRQNLEAGIRHLRRLLDRYEVPVALAAYNAGEGAVVRHGGLPPYPETRAYVARVLARAGLAPVARSARRGHPPANRGRPQS